MTTSSEQNCLPEHTVTASFISTCLAQHLRFQKFINSSLTYLLSR